MNKILVFLCLVVFSANVLSQENRIADQFTVEFGGFFFREFYAEPKIEFYNELSFSPSFFFNLKKNFHLGLRSYIVRGASPISPTFSAWHSLIGPVIRYHLVKADRVEMNAELGYFYGNYCPRCTPDEAYYSSNLHYLGLQLDLNIQLMERLPFLWLKAGFATNNVINLKSLSGYNLPLLGVQYRFGKLP